MAVMVPHPWPMSGLVFSVLWQGAWTHGKRPFWLANKGQCGGRNILTSKILSSHSLPSGKKLASKPNLSTIAHLSSPIIVVVIRECFCLFGDSLSVDPSTYAWRFGNKIPSLMTKKSKQYVCTIDHTPVVQAKKSAKIRNRHQWLTGYATNMASKIVIDMLSRQPRPLLVPSRQGTSLAHASKGASKALAQLRH